MINSFDDFNNSVGLFNEIAGNLEGQPTSEAAFNVVARQFERVEEEAREGVDAGAEGNLEQLLDAAVDSLVTAFGAMQMLQNNFPSVDCAKAVNLICKNNLSKFTPDMTKETEAENISHYAEKGEEVVIIRTKVEGVEYGVVRRVRDNKIMKPVGYEPVSLKECL